MNSKMPIALAAVLTATAALAVPGKPYTHLNYLDDPDDFRFAIVPDRQGANTGGREFREGFKNAIRVVNSMRPNFVMSVGDLIPYGWFSEASVRNQHKEMDALLAKMVPPFFWVVGNHDIAPSYIHPNHPRTDVSKANEISTKVWDELRGPEYYSFIYKGCLFIALNTIDHVRVGSKHSNISPEQYAWFRDELAKHKDVRWTFIFMHQPAVWRTKEWFDFETANLVQRKYTVFAGDWHTYLHVRRHGHDYYALGVAGGASGNGYGGGDMKKREKLLGREYGDLEHVMWVTMTREGPIITNIELSGIVDHDYLDQRNTKCVSLANTAGPLDYPVPEGTIEHLQSLKAEYDRYWAAEKAKKK